MSAGLLPLLKNCAVPQCPKWADVVAGEGGEEIVATAALLSLLVQRARPPPPAVAEVPASRPRSGDGGAGRAGTDGRHRRQRRGSGLASEARERGPLQGELEEPCRPGRGGCGRGRKNSDDWYKL